MIATVWCNAMCLQSYVSVAQFGEQLQERKREKEVLVGKLQQQVDELTSCVLCCASSKLMLADLVNGSWCIWSVGRAASMCLIACVCKG